MLVLALACCKVQLYARGNQGRDLAPDRKEELAVPVKPAGCILHTIYYILHATTHALSRGNEIDN